MEIASDELITQADRELAGKALNELCEEACTAFSETEGKATAQAVFYDSVIAAAQGVAAQLSEESVTLAREIVAGMLKDSSQHPYVESLVIEAVRPVARDGAFAAIRRWCKEQAIPKAEEAATRVIAGLIGTGCSLTLQTAAIAGIRVLLQNRSAESLSSAERQAIIDDYLSGEEIKRAILDYFAKGMTPHVRREAQKKAEKAVEEIAAGATLEIARDEALDAARVVATDTAKLEISRLVLAEAQRRAARIARERLQQEALALDEDKRAEYCQEEATKIADEAVKSVTEEIADPSVADLDLEKARELALSAASAVAREFSGAYQLSEDDTMPVNAKTIVFLVVQVLIGGFVVWFFLLGGYEICQPAMRAILPPEVYKAIYRSVPPPKPAVNNSKNQPEVDDLLDGQKPSAVGGKNDDDEPVLNDLRPTPSTAHPGTSTGSSTGTGNSTTQKTDAEAPKEPSSENSPPLGTGKQLHSDLPPKIKEK